MKQQLSYLNGASEAPLLGMTIGELLDRSVAQYPDNDALISRHQQLRYSYRDFHAAVTRAARGLLALGVEPGERVGIWSTNNAEWCITQFATAKIGAILVNINPSYRTSELEYVLRQSGTNVLITEGAYKNSEYARMLVELEPALDQPQDGDLRSEKLPELRAVICLDEALTRPGMQSWQSLMQAADRVAEDAVAKRQDTLDFDDPINIQYTSGTTGSPKGATLTHHNILNNGYFAARSMQFSDRDRLVIPVPLYHCFGMVLGNLACVSHGATMIYPSPVFDPTETLMAAQEEGATALYGVPTMFIAELEQPDFESFDLSTLRTGMMAGSNCPRKVMDEVIRNMGMEEVTIGYGQTETSPLCAQTRHDAPFEKRVTTVGSIHPHVEVKIVDPDTGSILPRGERGELCTRGYGVMCGYWRNEEATQKSIQRGWMHSGDLAQMDEDGYIAVIGRIKDMIIRGGENVYPREIEEFLYTHSDISDVQVVGIPDPRMGEEVMAWVKPMPDASVTEEDVKSFCEGRIAHYKIPRYVCCTDEFPLTVTGKVQKFKLREMAIETLGLDAQESA